MQVFSFPHRNPASRASPSNRVRQCFVLVPCAYLAFLGGVSLVRSRSRHSVLMDSSVAAVQESVVDQASPVNSRVQLQEFHRVEVRDGKPVWEVQAKDAKYFPLDHVTHVNEADLTLFREKGEKVTVRAASAKLYLAGDGLLRSVLEGKTVISSSDHMTLETEGATFDSTRGEFVTDSSVVVSGEGFRVEGSRMRYEVSSAIVQFTGGVSSQFESGASMPMMANTGIPK